MKNIKLLIFLGFLAFAGCSKEVPPPPSGNNIGGGSTTTGGGGSTTGGGGSTTTGGGGTSTSRVLTFWSDFDGEPIQVYVNGTYKGTITSYYNSAPGCNASGCVSVNMGSASSCSYTATDGSYNWSKTISLSSACTQYNLTR